MNGRRWARLAALSRRVAGCPELAIVGVLAANWAAHACMLLQWQWRLCTALDVDALCIAPLLAAGTAKAGGHQVGGVLRLVLLVLSI